MERSRSLLGLLLASLAAGAAAQGRGRPKPEELPPVLRRVMEASASVTFAGVREVFFKRPRGEDFRSRERVLRQGNRMRIEFRPGSPFAGQVIIQTSSHRYHYFPERREMYEFPAMPDPLGLGPVPLDLRGRRGQGGRFITEDKQEMVAGIRTVVVRQDGPDGKALQRLWVDGQRGLILRRRAYDGEGNPLAGFEFISIKYSPTLSPKAFEMPDPNARLITQDMAVLREAADLDVKPYRLPSSSGFQLMGVRKMDSEKMSFLWQSYRRDRDRLTFFLVKGAVDAERISKLAGERGRSSTHIWQRDGLTMVLIGTMPPSRLKALAESVVLAR